MGEQQQVEGQAAAGTGAVGEGQQQGGEGGQQQPPAPAPDSVEGLQGRLARRQQALDDRTAQLRAFTDLGVTPQQVQELLAGQQGQGGQQQAPAVDEAAIRAQVTTELTAQANRRVLEADLRAAAAGRLADPEDALRFVDLNAIQLGADGRAHRDDLGDAIAGLLEKKAYLGVVQPAPEPRFGGTAGGGSRTPEPPKSLATRIAEAEAAGDINTSMALKSQQLFEANKNA